MRKALKWIGIGLGGLVVLLLLAAMVLYAIGSARLNKNHDIQAEGIKIPTDDASLARGRHLVKGPALCAECHGQDLSGELLFDEPGIVKVHGTNITGLGETHSDGDLIRSIRHGVDTDGRQLVIMPADIYIHLSAGDMGAIIAYLKTLPRVGNDIPEPEVSVMGRILLAAGMFGDVFPAEYIEHNRPFPTMPAIGANGEYGEYLAAATGCTSCHGEDLSGELFDPEAPPAPDLTPVGELGGWSEAYFIQTFRIGGSPQSDEADHEFMPWDEYAKMTDEELKALWMYLKSLPGGE
jgi:cytochrome c553